MTQGETLFYLREIHSHWGASNLSSEKLAELEAAKLIECNHAAIAEVRLTGEGSRQKMLGRHHSMVDGISLGSNGGNNTGNNSRRNPRNNARNSQKNPRNNRSFRNRTSRKQLPQARPLV